MPNTKWSDDGFLNSLRAQGDPQADGAIAQVVAAGQKESVGPLFMKLKANATPLPDDTPQALKDFMAATAGMPSGLNLPRLKNGGDAFLRNGVPAVVVLLASSLPRGYGAPCLCDILSISKDLEGRPFDRLMGVVQLLINISDGDAFQPDGRALITARKLRLLHAGVRRIAKRYRPDYQQKFGIAVNHEDMLATIMAFSYLVVDGLQRMGLPMQPEESEDLFYLWRVFAQLMGIHPDGRPDDDSYVPANLAEAGEFYASYVRRNNTGPDRNPHGPVLAQENLKMMETMLPAPLKMIGFPFAPRIVMTELMSPSELERVGIAPLAGHHVIKSIFAAILRISQRAEHRLFAANIGRLVLQGMVDTDRGSEVEFGVAFSRLGLRGATFT